MTKYSIILYIKAIIEPESGKQIDAVRNLLEGFDDKVIEVKIHDVQEVQDKALEEQEE